MEEDETAFVSCLWDSQRHLGGHCRKEGAEADAMFGLIQQGFSDGLAVQLTEGKCSLQLSNAEGSPFATTEVSSAITMRSSRQTRPGCLLSIFVLNS